VREREREEREEERERMSGLKGSEGISDEKASH